MKKVTNKSLLDQLNGNGNQQYKSPLKHIKKIEDPGALATFGRSAFNATPEAIGNLLSKFGLSNPQIMQEALYGKGEAGKKAQESHEQGQMAHPLADFGGSAIGFGPLGFETSAALRSIPMVGRAVKAAAPSLLKRSAVHGLEGATMGGLYSPEGSEGEGMLYGGLLGSLLGGPGKSIVKSIPGVSKGSKDILNFEELKKNHAHAYEANQTQQAMIDAIKRQYSEQGAGLNNPEGITRKINEKTGLIDQNESNAQVPFRQTENLLESPQQFNTRETAQNATREATDRLRDVHYMMEPGATHDVQFANRFQDNVRHIKNQIQRTTYEPAYQYAQSQHVALPRVGEIEAIDQRLRDVTGNLFERNPNQFEELRNSLIRQSGGGHDLVPMTDYLGQWKATRNAANRARSLSRKEGEPDQAYWEREHRNLQNLADRQLDILQNHMPATLFNGLMEGNRLWRENVTPLYGNKIYEQSKNIRGSKGRGRLDISNIMHELRGNEAGQQLARQITLSDPELNRLAISHTYSENPEGLLNLNQNESEFLNNHPRLRPAVENLRQSRFNEHIANRVHENRQQTAQESHRRFLEEEVPKQKQRQKSLEKIEKLNGEIKDLKYKRERLNLELEKGDLTKKEFEKLDAELKKTIESKNRFKHSLRTGLALIGIKTILPF